MGKLRTVAAWAAAALLLCANAALLVEVAALKSQLRAAQRLASSALEAEGFYRSKLVSQRRLNRKLGALAKRLADELDAASLHIAALERATAKLETRVRTSPSPGPSRRGRGDVSSPLTGEDKGGGVDARAGEKGAKPCVPVPWTDGRLTLEDYDAQTRALTYSLHQRFRLVGTYIADARGQIRFGKLELYELAPESWTLQGTDQEFLPLDGGGADGVIGTAEITDYELLAAKTRRRWRPRIGVLAGAELNLEGSLRGLSTGVEVALGRLSIFGLANIKSEPTLVIGAGWRW